MKGNYTVKRSRLLTGSSVQKGSSFGKTLVAGGGFFLYLNERVK